MDSADSSAVEGWIAAIAEKYNIKEVPIPVADALALAEHNKENFQGDGSAKMD